MTPDVKAAAEELAALLATTQVDDSIDEAAMKLVGLVRELATLAAGGAEAVTEEWLNSFADEMDALGVFDWQRVNQSFFVEFECVTGRASEVLVKTRAQVRNLAAAICVPLTEKGN